MNWYIDATSASQEENVYTLDEETVSIDTWALHYMLDSATSDNQRISFYSQRQLFQSETINRTTATSLLRDHPY